MKRAESRPPASSGALRFAPDISLTSDTSRLLLLSPPQSYRIAAYLDAARELGIELVVASDGKHSLTHEVANGIHIDFTKRERSIDSVCSAHAEAPFAGIVATDDATVELAAVMAEALGLAHNSPESARLTRRKDLARQRLADAGVAVPGFRVISLEKPLAPQIAGLNWPQVFKPVSLSASTGVIRVDGLRAALAATDIIAELIASLPDRDERQTILAEEYIPGEEVAVEGFLHRGEYRPITIFDKPDPLTGPYFEETCYITPSRLPTATQQVIARTVAAACAAYGLVQGPVHAELRVDNEQVWMLEVAGRTIGGECSRALDAGLQGSLEKHVLASAFGMPLALNTRDAAAGVMMIPTPKAGMLRHVDGVQSARAVAGITDLRLSARVGHQLEMLPKASSYLGFIFAEAETPEQVLCALRQSHAELTFIIDPFIPLRLAVDN